MKRILSIALVALMALIPCLAQAETAVFFEPITDGDIEYYDMLGSLTESSFDSGLETFYKNYFSKETKDTTHNKNYHSLLYQWAGVAQSIVEGADENNPNSYWGQVKSDVQVNGGFFGNYTGTGSAGSIKKAVNAAAAGINGVKPTGNYEMARVYVSDDFSDKETPCFYYWGQFRTTLERFQ